MLTIFDWIRCCQTGAELIATLEHFKDHDQRRPDHLDERKAIGPPFALFQRPCKRCWLYPVYDITGLHYCRTCLSIMALSKQRVFHSRHAVLIWGNVNQLPKHLKTLTGFYAENIMGSFLMEEQGRFLLAMQRLKLRSWLQELLLYHGSDLKGLIQVFPTVGLSTRGTMSDCFCRAVHLDSRFPMDMLRIRFYAGPFQLFAPHLRERNGLLTFDVRVFLKYLEMACIFRSLLRPEEQKVIWKLVDIKNPTEERFSWGRVMGDLRPEARDMLESWDFRNWPPGQIKLLYELADYAEYTF